MAGVIWVIGWSMILLAILSRLPAALAGAFGLILIFGHNMLDGYIYARLDSLGEGLGAGLWKILYVGFFAGPIGFGPNGPTLIVLYSIIPWIGVMAAGYAFGSIVTMEPARRDRLCQIIGAVAIALFLVLRAFNIYGDPQPWSATGAGGAGPPLPPLPPLLSFLNTTKYPASLLFLLMTLGPAIALMPLLEKARGGAADWLAVFGRVPFFYYMLHIPLIHVLALAVSQVRLGQVSPWLFGNHPMGAGRAPEGYMWSLPQLYLIWALTLVILYPACRWFADVKSRRKDWWLSYL
jgi:uncharacterized membrane protein